MSIRKLIEAAPINDMVSFSVTSDKDYRTKGSPFTGSARKHPYRDDKILVAVEGTNEIKLLEFKNADILHIEELKVTAGTQTGEAVHLFTFWIRKGANGLVYKPFTVE